MPNTLRELAQKRPNTKEALRKIQGFGQKRLRQFGDAFLSLIGDFIARHPDAAPSAHADYAPVAAGVLALAPVGSIPVLAGSRDANKRRQDFEPPPSTKKKAAAPPSVAPPAAAGGRPSGIHTMRLPKK